MAYTDPMERNAAADLFPLVKVKQAKVSRLPEILVAVAIALGAAGLVLAYGSGSPGSVETSPVAHVSAQAAKAPALPAAQTPSQAPTPLVGASAPELPGTASGASGGTGGGQIAASSPSASSSPAPAPSAPAAGAPAASTPTTTPEPVCGLAVVQVSGNTYQATFTSNLGAGDSVLFSGAGGGSATTDAQGTAVVTFTVGYVVQGSAQTSATENASGPCSASTTFTLPTEAVA